MSTSEQPKLNKPFDLTAWEKGAQIITRGGKFPVIAEVFGNDIRGFVGVKQIIWDKSGLNRNRPEYGHDLFMA